ncbi:MAG TPA: hypothetical protein VGJ26_12480, partial [Pirellulales bacterium]
MIANLPLLGLVMLAAVLRPESGSPSMARLQPAQAAAALVSLGAKLRVAPDGSVLGVDFSSSRAGDDDLRLLRALPALESVNLYNTPVTDDGLAALAELPKLAEVFLPPQIGVDGVRSACRGGVKRLGLAGSRMFDPDFDGRWQMREKLDLAGVPHLTDAALAKLRSYSYSSEVGEVRVQSPVRSLDLSGGRFTDAGMKHFCGPDGLIQLEHLALADTALTDAGLAQLQELHVLRRLDLGAPRITKAGVLGVQVTADGVARFKAALPDCDVRYAPRKIDLTEAQQAQVAALLPAGRIELEDSGEIVRFVASGKALTDHQRAALAGAPELIEIDLYGTPLAPADLAMIAGKPGLRRIDVGACGLLDANLAPLARLKSWEWLDLSNNAISDAGLATLVAAGDRAAERDGQAQKPPAAPRWLNVRGTEAQAAGLRKLTKAIPGLRVAFDSQKVAAHPAGVSIKLNADFDVVFLRSWKLDNAQLAELAQEYPRVEILEATHGSIDNQGLKALRPLGHLRELNLGHTKLTGAGLAELKGLTSLELLNLWLTAISDDGLKSLAGLVRLRELRMDETRISD